MIEQGRFEVPQSCREWENVKWADHLSNNYSNIPDKELKVVNACFAWSVLFVKYPSEITGKDSRAILRKQFYKQLIF
jgi:hypothetical protein